MEKIINGFINIDKPRGITSHDVVDSIREILDVQKVGHTGTLDPLATGVLPICVGKATKLLDYIVVQKKRYRATMRLGIETETGDSEGAVIRVFPKGDISEARIREAMKGFIGGYLQIPPMYSAIKVGGVPLYKKARAGKVLARKPRQVSIEEMAFIQKVNEDVTFEVTCSKGTYIRSLCEDLGKALGIGAHLADLRRLQVGPFHIDKAIGLEKIKRFHERGQLGEVLYSMDEVLALPTLRVHSSISHRVLCGTSISRSGILSMPKGLDEGTRFKVHNPKGDLLAIVSVLSEKKEPGLNSEEEPIFKVEKVLGFPFDLQLNHLRVT
ncbi:MAG TPA: tRNA pseudouridine(55) synthase TruB [Nitrospiria bacterium]